MDAQDNMIHQINDHDRDDKQLLVKLAESFESVKCVLDEINRDGKGLRL